MLGGASAVSAGPAVTAEHDRSLQLTVGLHLGGGQGNVKIVNAVRSVLASERPVTERAGWSPAELEPLEELRQVVRTARLELQLPLPALHIKRPGSGEPAPFQLQLVWDATSQETLDELLPALQKARLVANIRTDAIRRGTTRVGRMEWASVPGGQRGRRERAREVEYQPVPVESEEQRSSARRSRHFAVPRWRPGAAGMPPGRFAWTPTRAPTIRRSR